MVIICRKCQMGKINRWWQRGTMSEMSCYLSKGWLHWIIFGFICLSQIKLHWFTNSVLDRWGHKDANDDHVHEEGGEGVGDDGFLVTEILSEWWHRHFRDCLEWIVSRISDISHHHESYFTLRKSSSRTEPPLTSCPRAYTTMPWWRFTSCAQL